MSTVALNDLSELRAFVRERLCASVHLDPNHAEFSEAVLTRGERVCGRFYQIEGSKRLACYAIWAGDEHRLLFYDTKGTRFDEIRLSEAPDPAASREPLTTSV